MTTNTPTLSLVLYDTTTDQAATFSNFRAVQSGASGTSNMYKIDTAITADRVRLTSLESKKSAVLVSALYDSPGYYTATVASITSHVEGDLIILKLDTTTNGATTLQINALGILSISKTNSAGTIVNLDGGELSIGKNYLFRYDGARWMWVSSTSADQIYISGTAGNHVIINTDNTLVDGGVGYTLGGDIYFTGDISPAQITSNQNDYAPTGLSTASTLRLSTDASRNVTGLTGGADGRIIIIANIGSYSAANRFILYSDTTINSNQDVIMQYDSTSSRWRLIGGTGAGGGASNRSWFGV
jgi:hypothetical protein